MPCSTTDMWFVLLLLAPSPVAWVNASLWFLDIVTCLSSALIKIEIMTLMGK